MSYKEIPEILVVGIGYPIKGIEDWGAWRWCDLTPTSNPKADKEWEEYLSRSNGRDDYDIWLIKTNASGDTLWTKTFGGDGYEGLFQSSRLQTKGIL